MVALLSPLTASPGVTETANTPAFGDNSGAVATTAFVANATRGTVTINTTGGNLTLTQAQASAAVLLVTGALTANSVLIVPNTGLFVIANRTSGTFTLTIKTLNGTGQSIAQGYTEYVFADGVNILRSDTDAITSPGPGAFTDLSISTSFAYGANSRSTDLSLNINAAAGTNRTISLQSGGLNRFAFGITGTVEGGSQAGSNLVLSRWNDDGSYGADILTIYRDSGYIQFGSVGTTTLFTNTAIAGDSSTLAANTAFVTNAVDGMTTFSTTGGTTTLTQAQYAAAVLVITGALTSNALLTMPNSGIVTIINRTSGAFTVTLKTANGTGTTIAQGAARNLIADGANVVPSESDYSGGRFDTITGTTNVTVPLIRTNTSALNLASAKGTQITVGDDGITTLLLNGAPPAANGQFVRLAFDSTNYIQNTYAGGFSIPAADAIKIGTQGAIALNLPLGAQPAVNYTQIDNAIAGVAPKISAQGSDANISLSLSGKGTGSVLTTGLASSGYTYRSGATGLSAAGTTQATATAINKSNSVFTTVAAAGAGGVLPNLPPVNGAFAEFTIVNAGANAMNLYPASGLLINALAANAAFSIAAGSVVRGIQISTTAYRFG